MYDSTDRCRVCGGETHLFTDLGQYRYGSKEFVTVFPDIRIQICDQCQLIQTNIADTEQNDHILFEYYSKNYRDSDEIIDLSATDTLFYKRGVGISNIIKQYVPKEIQRSDKTCIVFEKGAGYGFNLMMIKKILPQSVLYTDEMSEATFRYHSEIGIINQIPEKADIVILSHVLEHFLDPRKELFKLDKMLNKDGLLYIEVPNSMRLSEPHISCFTPESLLNMYSLYFADDYELLDMRTTGFPLYPLNDTLMETCRLKFLNRVKRHVDTYSSTNWRIKNGVYLRMLLRKR